MDALWGVCRRLSRTFPACELISNTCGQLSRSFRSIMETSVCIYRMALAGMSQSVSEFGVVSIQ